MPDESLGTRAAQRLERPVCRKSPGRGPRRARRRRYVTAHPRGTALAPPPAVTPTLEEVVMLYWSLLFFVVALIAGVLGFTGISEASAGIARVLFFVFLVIFAVSLIAGSGL